MISFNTTTPHALLATVKKTIDNKSITTWSYNSNGDFTHTPPQWIHKAWLRPTVVNGELRFAIVCPRGGNLSKEIYAIYHGRFSEMMLAHFDTMFEGSRSTALAATGDVVRAAA
jgi:hypothetical protein